ncbi:MAG: HpcH/HpaI aldolase/citrate lyase family protein, partial [Candidatus Binatia bacterium]
HTEWAYRDVIAVVEGAGEKVDILILPKVKAPRDVWFFETLLDQLEKKLGLKRRIALEALIEEAEALARIEEIAASSPRLVALILGFGDLSASQGVRWGLVPGYPGDFWHYARARLVVAARACGIDAIDGPFANFRDPDGYGTEAKRAAALGFVGKWAIHPSQIELANEAFAPTDQEIALARQMVEAYRAAESGGEGAAGVGGVLIDAATARIYEAILERARLTGR